jgi:ABC-2 type transport system ATP-binding protein
MSAITTTGLSVRFRRTVALNDCNLDVPSGCITALVGANGAGKTTLLNCAVGLLGPSTGEVTVIDGLPAGSPEARDQVGFVAQDAPLYKSLSVGRSLDLAENLNRTFDRQWAERRLAELGTLNQKKIGSLSLGQQAQVSLTLALARHPKLLILDEPLARLDPIARHEFMRLVLDAALEDGVSVLYSSHVVSELEQVADYLIILAEGQVEISQSIESLLENHTILVGPVDELDELRRQYVVLGVRRAGRQAQVLACRSGLRVPVPIGWEASSAQLEELVLAYLGLSAPSAPNEVKVISSWSAS